MGTLGYTLIFGTLGVAAGFILLKMFTALTNGHGIDSVLYSLPFG